MTRTQRARLAVVELRRARADLLRAEDKLREATSQRVGANERVVFFEAVAASLASEVLS